MIFDSFHAVARSISFTGASGTRSGPSEARRNSSPSRMRDEHGPMAAGPQAEHGQEDLLLSPAPGARGVDVEGEHSSQSFANFSPT